ncbi:receptor-like serine/threonine-protein kinase ALE2 isoform X1 [Zingiber officinale]|uniref:receptor-like serine/threonine-protein kinase ALE2 isoform X1 n=1 Tax=Zingiber officinale TaxID=94328 RepID=UPI001C4B9AD5|nr:receptor-like serine/threonine-protein kinase ALE2 isoform X1 [Zingiber officinale]
MAPGGMLLLAVSSRGKMHLLAILALAFHLSPLCFGLSSTNPPENRKGTIKRGPVPDFPQNPHVNAQDPIPKDHDSVSLASSPALSTPWRGQDCDDVVCSEPFMSTAIGSPCDCVLHVRVTIDLGVPPYIFFTHITEFEAEMAAGTFLKQSQIKIMSAVGLKEKEGTTRVTIFLVPLGEKFDTTLVMLIYERLWQKKVPINKSIFGDYEVIYVHYSGLPSSPPSMPRGSTVLGPDYDGSYQYPLIAVVPMSKLKKINAAIIAVIVVSSFILILACSGIILFILKWKNLGRQPASLGSTITQSVTRTSGIKCMVPNSINNSPSDAIVLASCPPALKVFSLAEIEKATEKFCSNKILGEGGFGCVYHGTLDDGSEVAVKLLSKRNQNGEHFLSEVEMLSRLHHQNLVKLIGICTEDDKSCLVYELVRNGSVESHLHGVDKKKGPLEWDIRVKIALGAARGLAYLHEHANPHIIHRDFKSSNVLLAEDFTAKVTDFGLAREVSEGSQHVSTRVMGTFGYVAPEYAMTGHLLVSSDVYSYGVVLLELLTGRRPVYYSSSREPENLVTWARPLLATREGVMQVMDPSLHGRCNFDDVVKVAAVASICVHSDPSQRPFMSRVVQALKLICHDMDDADSQSQKESSSGREHDYGGDLEAEMSWWSQTSPLSYRHGSPFITMEYNSLDSMDQLRRIQRASASESKYSRSAPSRISKQKTSLYKLRRNVSEHGHLCANRPYGSSF